MGSEQPSTSAYWVSASLLDFLLALQTYTATKVDYFGDLTNYGTAANQLEEAVATELHR